jgi:hypothetical protein
MRYRGKFGRAAYPDIIIYPSDEGKLLEEKWRKWHQHESWKRCVTRVNHLLVSNFAADSSFTPTCATPKSP